uniref:Uncharacterized protein n=1 Tax=Timema shepardi TaxID=629360 RepID=A0A7R9B6C4_TIMSH|nr:unnamed protein product [Timema shepardi]
MYLLIKRDRMERPFLVNGEKILVQVLYYGVVEGWVPILQLQQLISNADQPTTFHRHSHGEEVEELKERLKEDGEGEEHAPPASALTRRRALVPPKLMAEGPSRCISPTSLYPANHIGKPDPNLLGMLANMLVLGELVRANKLCCVGSFVRDNKRPTQHVCRVGMLCACTIESSECSSPRARRSSIVVIPPMQICPGDLLVYSKVLTQRNNLVGK